MDKKRSNKNHKRRFFIVLFESTRSVKKHICRESIPPSAGATKLTTTLPAPEGGCVRI